MAERLRLLAKSTSGSTAMEYALIATLIGIAVLAAIQVLFNDRVSGLYSWSTTRLLNAMGY